MQLCIDFFKTNAQIVEFDTCREQQIERNQKTNHRAADECADDQRANPRRQRWEKNGVKIDDETVLHDQKNRRQYYGCDQQEKKKSFQVNHVPNTPGCSGPR